MDYGCEEGDVEEIRNESGGGMAMRYERRIELSIVWDFGIRDRRCGAEREGQSEGLSFDENVSGGFFMRGAAGGGVEWGCCEKCVVVVDCMQSSSITMC